MLGWYMGTKIQNMIPGDLRKAIAALTTDNDEDAEDKAAELQNTSDKQLRLMLANLVYREVTGRDPPIEVPVTQEQQDTLADLRVQIRDELQTLRNNNESVASAYVSIEAAARAFMSKLNMPVDSKKVADFTFDQLLDTYLKQAS